MQDADETASRIAASYSAREEGESFRASSRPVALENRPSYAGRDASSRSADVWTNWQEESCNPGSGTTNEWENADAPNEEEDASEKADRVRVRRRAVISLFVIVSAFVGTVVMIWYLVAHPARGKSADDGVAPSEGQLRPQEKNITSLKGQDEGDERNGNDSTQGDSFPADDEWNYNGTDSEDPFLADDGKNFPQDDTSSAGSNDTEEEGPNQENQGVYSEGAYSEFGVVNTQGDETNMEDPMLAPPDEGYEDFESEPSSSLRPSAIPPGSIIPTLMPSLGEGSSQWTPLGGSFGVSPHETTLDTSLPPLETYNDDTSSAPTVFLSDSTYLQPSGMPTQPAGVNVTTSETTLNVTLNDTLSSTNSSIEQFVPPPGRATDIFKLLKNSLQSSFLYFEPSASFLEGLNYDPVRELETPGTYNHEAYKWIVDADPLALDPLSDLTKMAEIYPAVMERFVLVRLFLSTGGGLWEVRVDAQVEVNAAWAEAPPKVEGQDNGILLLEPPEVGEDEGWIRYDGYMSDRPACTWHGVECDDSERVIALRLAGNGLKGTIPPELALLYKIQVIDFRANSLSGPLPLFLAQFPTLENIDLGGNKLNGSIAAGFYHAGLEYLDLGGNQLTGTLSTEGIGKLSALKYFSLEGNVLDGTVPEDIGLCISMETLNIGNNFFEGTFPWSAVASGMKLLRALWIHHNTFSGMLPEEIGALSPETLTHLVIYKNNFSGKLPTALGNLTKLTHLYLHETEFTGTIPSSFGLLSQLEVLQLQDTPLTGKIPSEVCDLRLEASLGDLRADCAPLTPDEAPRLVCECCTQCLVSYAVT